MGIVHWFLSKLSRRLMRRLIPRDDGLGTYMTRYRILGWMPKAQKTKAPVNIYLHNIHFEDSDHAPHNHPWNVLWKGGPCAISIVLSGGYEEYVEKVGKDITETLQTRHRTRLPLSVNFIYRDTFHRIDRVLPNTWTLIITGNKKGNPFWGFLVDGKLVHPDDRTKQRRLARLAALN